jgi:caffeoyl-CoA O-methyltransferase
MDEATHEALTKYVRDLFGQEDQHLESIRHAADEEGLPRISVAPEEGRLLQFLIRLGNVRTAVEIGTLAGYSATWIARALPEDGRLITLERDKHHAEVARELFVRGGLSSRVEVRVGEALDTLKKLTSEGPFDAVFIDANKDGYPAYLDWAVENVRIGGMILAHNALWSARVIQPDEGADENLLGLKAFNRRLSEDPRLLSVIIAMGDGLAAAIRVK